MEGNHGRIGTKTRGSARKNTSKSTSTSKSKSKKKEKAHSLLLLRSLDRLQRRGDRIHTMCGRYTLIRLADFTDMFPWIRPPETETPARYNIAPTQPVAVVPNSSDPHVEFFH